MFMIRLQDNVLVFSILALKNGQGIFNGVKME